MSGVDFVPSSEALSANEQNKFIRKGILLKRGSNQSDRYVRRYKSALPIKINWLPDIFYCADMFVYSRPN